MGSAGVEHVGHALRVRRELLGVTLDEMIESSGYATKFDLKWTESAPAPTMARVRYFDATLRTVAQGLLAWLTLPYAQREQWYDTDLDEALWREAMRAHRKISWWWGATKSRGQTGAWCYLCEDMVHSYDAGRPMTLTARGAIMAHRATHSAAGVASAAILERQER